MEKQITNLLTEALDDLESLRDYYHWQLDSTQSFIRKNIENNKYAILLNKYFLNKTTDKEKYELSEQEQAIIEKILDNFEIEKSERQSKIEYYLKNITDLKGFELSVDRAQKSFKKAIARLRTLNESTLIIVLIKYEECISNLFRFLIENYPDAYLSDKSITYSEIVIAKENIRDIKTRFIDREVDEIMRKPVSDWYKLINNKHSNSYAFDDSVAQEFKKAYYRRNIVVHNQGIVNETYLKNVEDKEYSIGDKLIINSEYVNDAIDNAAIVLIQTIWSARKLADDTQKLSDALFEKGYDYLKSKDWDAAMFINGLLLNDGTQNEEQLLCERINYWIAKKNKDGVESIKEEVESLDVSAMNRRFVVAKHALLNETDSAIRILDEIIDLDIHAIEVAEWPLFEEIRRSEQYKGFSERHRKIFEKFGYTPNQQEEEEMNEVSRVIEKEKEDLINSLKESNSFAMTHSIIEKLSDYDQWSTDEVEEMCGIAIDNTQVKWVLGDEDINKFYKKLIEAISEETLGESTKDIKKRLDSN